MDDWSDVSFVKDFVTGVGTNDEISAVTRVDRVRSADIGIIIIHTHNIVITFA